MIYFKNHTEFKLEGDEDIIAIAGLNGVGKTSVLDAVHFLCIGKSYFSSTDVQCIQSDKEQAGIIATVFSEEKTDLKIKFKRGGRKQIEKNGVKYKRALEHIGQFIAVVIAPGDIELVYGSNEKRRSFVNQVLSQTDNAHLQDLVMYNKLIDHRNKHLKQDEIDNALLNVLDDQIGPLAEKIYVKRKEFLSNFCTVFSNEYHKLSGKKEDVKLTYVSQLEHDSYANLVIHNRAKDLAVQRSFTGIHKDELEITIGDFNLRKYGSQGQIKSALIAMKLAEFEYLQQETRKTPLLLLDDIFEKIDEERAQVLTQIIKNGKFGQIFITDTNEDRLNGFCEDIGKSFKTIILK